MRGDWFVNRDGRGEGLVESEGWVFVNRDRRREGLIECRGRRIIKIDEIEEKK